ncbi:MAG: mobile mystery protein A [Alphaproteobacteria bacterium]|nr:mobile mystery protein A [Alphaproteobacteria bacterium]MBE8220591.1 mobile mystery protein A [Alphaproteobacteria bacterium]
MERLQIRRLDKHITQTLAPDMPLHGWLKSIRTSLNMSLAQVAKRLGVSKQSAARLEANEVDNSITLKSLRRAAAAMDCYVVYALVPKDGSLNALVEKQAQKKAHELLDPVTHTMMLEDQESPYSEYQLQDKAAEFVRVMPKSLWD